MAMPAPAVLLRAAALAAAASAVGAAAQAAGGVVEASVGLGQCGCLPGRDPPKSLLVGAGIEDVNNELYGGLYSQMVHGESFEEPPSGGVSGAGFEGPLYGGTSRPTWMPWSAEGRFAVSSHAFHGNQSQELQNGALANFGLGQQGMFFWPGREYEGYLYADAQGEANITVALTLDGGGVREALATRTFHLLPAGWVRLNFTLVAPATGPATSCTLTHPNGPTTPRAGFCGYFINPIPEIPDDGTPGPNFRTCYQCSGGLAIEAAGAAVRLDLVFLQPGAWGRYKGLPVRRDAAEVMFDTIGLQVLRLGGTMCNAKEYRWKRFRGYPREPYTAAWHPYASGSFRIFETLALCEAAGVYCVITVNNEEAPGDMADFIEYCFGSEETPWGRRRIADGREKPYGPFTVEVGNEQGLTEEFVEQVRGIAMAMQDKARELGLRFPIRIAVGHNIGPINFNATQRIMNTTVQMLQALHPLGANAAWDAHIGGDRFKDSDDFRTLLQESAHFFRAHGSDMKFVVFEENGNTHNMHRALVHARMHVVASYDPEFMQIDTAANGLQVFSQNDNGWDQGQVFMTPEKAWASPFGWSQAMLSQHSKAFPCPVPVSVESSPDGLDVGVYAGADGAIGVRAVRWQGGAANISLRFRGWRPSATISSLRFEAEELAAELHAVNPPWDERRVAPRPASSRGSLRRDGDDLVVGFEFVPSSFVTMAILPAVIFV